jgi:hypothetical protein
MRGLTEGKSYVISYFDEDEMITKELKLSSIQRYPEYISYNFHDTSRKINHGRHPSYTFFSIYRVFTESKVVSNPDEDGDELTKWYVHPSDKNANGGGKRTKTRRAKSRRKN